MDPAELGQFWCRAGASTYRDSNVCGTEGVAPEEAFYGGGVCSQPPLPVHLGQRLILERRKELGGGS